MFPVGGLECADYFRADFRPPPPSGAASQNMQRIAGNTLDAEVGFRDNGRQPTGADHFIAVLESVRLNICAGTPITVRQGLVNSQRDDIVFLLAVRDGQSRLTCLLMVLDIDLGQNPCHQRSNHVNRLPP